MENLTQKWIQSGYSLQNQDTFFSIFKIGQGRPPSLPPSCAPECNFIAFIHIFRSKPHHFLNESFFQIEKFSEMLFFYGGGQLALETFFMSGAE